MNTLNFEPNREAYDHADQHTPKYTAQPGLSEELIRKISSDKKEPEWMLNKRLKGLELFNKTPLPNWGPSLKELDFDKIVYYIDPNAKETTDWKEVPEEIKRTFDKLGIPEAEKKVLAGVGAQYDAGVVYHNLKKDLEEKGVIFENMDVALQKHPELVKKYFMTSCIPITTHKFTMLHAAVWSGGTFIYVPKNVKVELPLQAYFRMNAQKGGQFEHTLIVVDEGAELHYIEGCLAKGTLVATNPDYKPIEQIKEGDKVLTHRGQYKIVKSVSETPYSGDIYQISCYGDSVSTIEATFNHPFLWAKRQRNNERNHTWKLEWNIPKYMNKLDYLVLPINKSIVTNDHHEFEILKGDNKGRYTKIKKLVKCNKDFFRLIGYFLSEGSISAGAYVNFSFAEKETRFIEDVERLIKNVFGVRSYRSQNKKNHGIDVRINSTEIARILTEFGKSCDTKQIPHWMILEDPEKQKELIKGLWYGDGNYYKKQHKSGFKEALRYCTTSEKLAKQVRDILLRCKVFGFINKRDRSKEGRKSMFTVGVSGEYLIPLAKILGMKPVEEKMHRKKRATRFYIDDNFAYLPIKNITKKDVKDYPVFDLSVEDDESFVANFAVVHNCSSPRYQESSLHAGCVEIHVLPNAKMKYTSVENWSKNVYNLNTKRAMVQKDARITWVNANTGSKVTMLYPMSVLVGEGASSESVGIAFAGAGQNQDTGSKVLHAAPNTTSYIDSKSISKDGGIATYRGLMHITSQAKGSKAFMRCNSLILDEKSKADAIPTLKIENSEVDAAHEATVGKIGDEEIFYLMSRGLSKDEAVKMIVSGFIEPITKALPLEYAVELNKLIELEIEGH
jgi:Fe-S cluster assembly protein SufB